MPKFLCPGCGSTLSDESEDRLVNRAIEHLEERHGKEHVTHEYVLGNIRARTEVD